MSIKILIDSASDISITEAKKMGVEMIPLRVSFDKLEYFDGIDLLPNQFYEKLVSSDITPKTSQINPYRFEEAFERLVADGHQVLVICISSKLSNTYNSAVIASMEYAGKVVVVDSLSAAVGERLLCEYALDLISKGLSLEEVANELNFVKTKINLIAVVDTLEYLKRGGRISKTVAFAGELLSIKPVISIVDGEVKLIGKARGTKKANALLNELVNQKGGINFEMPYGTVYSGLSDETLRKYISEYATVWGCDKEKVPMYIVGSTIGTHVGPGAIGVAFFEK